MPEAHPAEVREQALALYAQTHSSYKAAELLGIAQVDPTSIQRWANAIDGFTAKLQQERKTRLADGWYEIAERIQTRMLTSGIDALKDDQLAVPAAIATDKYHKLVTEEGAQEQVKVGQFIIERTVTERIVGNVADIRDATAKDIVSADVPVSVYSPADT